VWPVKRGVASTRVQILLYIVGFIAANLALSFFGYTGYAYAVIMAGLGGYWLSLGVRGFQADKSRAWGRRMFLHSLVVILVLSVMLAIGPLLP
jgi:protoheme IX farnesyltransferase